MKYIKVLGMMVFLCILLPATAFAKSQYILTTKIDEARQLDLFSNFDIKRLENQNLKYGINSFDIRDDGYILLGVGDSTSNEIYAYDSEGEYQFGFSYSNSGKSYVEWNDDFINLYIVRGAIVITFDTNAGLIEIKSIKAGNEGVTWNRLNQNSITLKGVTYRIEKSPGIASLAPAYSKLLQINEDGTTKIIYDVSKEYDLKIVIIFLITSAFFVSILVLLIRKFVITHRDKKRRERPYSTTQP